MFQTISKTYIGIAVAGAGLCLLGYCIYFDRKRRNDPQFKQKLRERRRKNKTSTKKPSNTVFPDFQDTEAMQNFFMKEIQTGEELLAQGSIDEGVDHITNAVAVCGQPQQLLTILQQTLPQQVFQKLIQRLPEVSQKISSALMSERLLSGAAGAATSSTDLELE